MLRREREFSVRFARSPPPLFTPAMKYHIKTIVALLATATVGVGPLTAQLAPQPDAADTGSASASGRNAIPVVTDEKKETPVVLSPFEVTSTKDTGYQATD